MSAPHISIALVQQATERHSPEANLQKAARFVEDAASRGARVVAFPELFTTGFTMKPEPWAEEIPGRTTEAMARLARTYGVWIIASCVEAHSPRPRNAAFAIRPDGSIAAVYRKIHPFSFGEENLHYSGGDECPVFSLDGVPTALQVCYDLRFPEPFRAISAKGVQLVFVLANWPSRRVAHWSTLLAARAIENQCAVAGVNRVGVDPNVDYPGLSAIHDARGEILAFGGESEGLVMASVNFAEVESWRAQFPALRDRRPDVYVRL